MKTNRRTFLKQIGALSLAFTCDPLNAIANKHVKANTLSRRITILHTNDVHSHIDPIQADNIGNIHIGGFARRKTYIDKVRNEVDNLLVLECGDMFQGSAISNMTQGGVVVDCMNEIGFDAMAVGNHGFDWGVDIIEKYNDKTILLVTHEGITKVINCYFNGIPEDGNLQMLGLKNCEVKIYEVE